MGSPITSIWRLHGMGPLIAMTFTGFSGYALLLPVAPLWAVHGGASTASSGLVNGVLLLFTVLTQLWIPAALLRFGWARVLAAGMVLLGVPAALYVVSDALWVVLALSAVRGVGFGVLTVTGSAAVAALIGSERRGEAIGTYGLAIAVPNVVLLPAGPWIADQLGFATVFALSALPLLGIPAAVRLASVLRYREATEDPTPSGSVAERDSAAYLRLLRPMLLLLVVTLAGGAVITFTPQMIDDAAVVTAGLLLMGVTGALSRWRAGILADQYGAQRFLAPLIALTGVAMAMIAWSVLDEGDADIGLFLAAMALVGLCYGALQNLTLVVSFAAVSRRHHTLASAVWNAGFDAGTAIGSVAVGAITMASSFSAAFLIAGGIAVAVLPLAVHRPVTDRIPG